MVKKTLSAIGIAGHDLARTPSKGQAAFNALIDKIEKRRATLAGWEAFGDEFRRKFNDGLLPLQGSLDALCSQLVQRLDSSHDAKGLTKTERQTIEDLIDVFAVDLLATVDDPVVAEIHQRYNTTNAEEESAALNEMREAIQEILGADMPEEVDRASPEDMYRYFEEQMDQEEERDRARRDAKAAHHKKRGQSPGRAAAEDRARAEEAEVHLSIREVYRKLASALHPDREPDPVERERKAILMQRVNRAYASKSLLDLLELQMELEHIDQSVLESVSDDRLKRWNTILREQLRGLDQELAEVKSEYAMRTGLRPGHPVTPKTVNFALNTSIHETREGIRAYEHHLRVFDDVKRLKSWLKEMKRELAAQADYDRRFS